MGNFAEGWISVEGRFLIAWLSYTTLRVLPTPNPKAQIYISFLVAFTIKSDPKIGKLSWKSFAQIIIPIEKKGIYMALSSLGRPARGTRKENRNICALKHKYLTGSLIAYFVMGQTHFKDYTQSYSCEYCEHTRSQEEKQTITSKILYERLESKYAIRPPCASSPASLSCHTEMISVVAICAWDTIS